MTRKYKVLFLCRDNAARSIIAEALLRELAGHQFDGYSAGPEPAARVHPHASAQLRPGISDHGVLCPKSWLEFTGEWAPRMDLVIAMDACVDQNHAPVFPGEPAFRNWMFADPLADNLDESERARLFGKVFWQIVRQISSFIESPELALLAPDTSVLRAEAPGGDGMRRMGEHLANPLAGRLTGPQNGRGDQGDSSCDVHQADIAGV